LCGNKLPSANGTGKRKKDRDRMEERCNQQRKIDDEKRMMVCSYLKGQKPNGNEDIMIQKCYNALKYVQLENCSSEIEKWYRENTNGNALHREKKYYKVGDAKKNNLSTYAIGNTDIQETDDGKDDEKQIDEKGNGYEEYKAEYGEKEQSEHAQRGIESTEQITSIYEESRSEASKLANDKKASVVMAGLGADNKQSNDPKNRKRKKNFHIMANDIAPFENVIGNATNTLLRAQSNKNNLVAHADDDSEDDEDEDMDDVYNTIKEQNGDDEKEKQDDNMLSVLKRPSFYYGQ